MTIAAASDLTDLEKGLAALALPDCKTRFTFASSGLLAQQILHGAPYDLFISANSTFVNNLADAGVVRRETVHVYAYGQLAVWSKYGRTWRDLPTSAVNRISVANPALAPYGKAAIEALKSDGALWKAVEPKIVYGENVRQALQFAETGNADICLVSYPLVRERGGQLVDPKRYSPIPQGAAVVRRIGGSTAGATLLLNRLLSPAGQLLLANYGLLPGSTPERSAPKSQRRP